MEVGELWMKGGGGTTGDGCKEGRVLLMVDCSDIW